jgi:hypothetical protein
MDTTEIHPLISLLGMYSSETQVSCPRWTSPAETGKFDISDEDLETLREPPQEIKAGKCQGRGLTFALLLDGLNHTLDAMRITDTWKTKLFCALDKDN